MPDSSISNLVYKLATLRKKKQDNQMDLEHNNYVVSQDWLPREPSPALFESNPVASSSNLKTDSWGAQAYNAEKKRRATVAEIGTKCGLSDEASDFQIPGPPFQFGNSYFMNICESCGATHDGLYGSGRFCSKHCAKRVGARCKWNMVKGSQSQSKDTFPYLQDSNTEKKILSDLKLQEDTKTWIRGDPLHRLCYLAENEKKLLALENDAKLEMEKKIKKRLYKYQLWLLEQQKNCNIVDNLQQEAESAFLSEMKDSTMPDNERVLGDIIPSKAWQWNETPLTASLTSSCDDLHMKQFQEHSDCSVRNLLNYPFDSSRGSPCSSDEQCELPPFTTLEKAAEEGDREFALRKCYRR